jgi:predicted metal-dependent hydrolase
VAGVPDAAPDVRVIRSPRRRRTAAAREVGGTIEVRVPAGLGPAEESRIVETLVRRVVTRRTGREIDLDARAALLAARHGLRRPDRIEWVDNQRARWGSCSPATRHVRLSRRLAGMPPWVLDYVIVHELAHLDVPGHGPDFWALVNRYPRTERARGYLIAKGGESDDDDPLD